MKKAEAIAGCVDPKKAIKIKADSLNRMSLSRQLLVVLRKRGLWPEERQSERKHKAEGIAQVHPGFLSAPRSTKEHRTSGRSPVSSDRAKNDAESEVWDFVAFKKILKCFFRAVFDGFSYGAPIRDVGKNNRNPTKEKKQWPTRPSTPKKNSQGRNP